MPAVPAEQRIVLTEGFGRRVQMSGDRFTSIVVGVKDGKSTASPCPDPMPVPGTPHRASHASQNATQWTTRWPLARPLRQVRLRQDSTQPVGPHTRHDKTAGQKVSPRTASGGAGGTRTHGRRIMSPLRILATLVDQCSSWPFSQVRRGLAPQSFSALVSPFRSLRPTCVQNASRDGQARLSIETITQLGSASPAHPQRIHLPTGRFSVSGFATAVGPMPPRARVSDLTRARKRALRAQL